MMLTSLASPGAPRQRADQKSQSPNLKAGCLGVWGTELTKPTQWNFSSLYLNIILPF